MRLRAEEARVLGSLVEKQLTTPQQYPLSMMALVTACNQSTNREPVVNYDEGVAQVAIDELKRLKLARSVLPSHGRSVVRYRHILDETLALDTRQCALVAVMLLRGPQTIGELRIRTDRMTEFDDLGQVTHELEFLASRDEPLAINVGRRPGQKEERWACPLMTQVHVPDASSTDGDGDVDVDVIDDIGPIERPNDIRSDLALLQAEVIQLRRDLDALRASLGE